MSPAEGISAILEGDNLIGGATGWASAVAGLHDKGQMVACLDSGGRAGEVKVSIDYPTVQVLVRPTVSGYSTGYAKARAIYDHLLAIENATEYPELVSCTAIGFINPLGRDANNHPIFSLNWQLIIEPTNLGNRDY